MTAPWQSLIANFAIVALCLAVWTQSQDWINRWSQAHRASAFGLLSGLCTMVLMLVPFELAPGVFFDLRSTLLMLSGLAFGPVAGLLTASLAIVCRWSLGGAGVWSAVMSILIYSAGGIVGHLLLRGSVPGRGSFVLLGIANAALGLACLLLLPKQLQAAAFATVAAPKSALGFVATVLAGLALHQSTRQRLISSANLGYRMIFDNLPDGLNVRDPQGRFEAANPATAFLMRAERPEAVIGKTDFDFYPAETAEQFEKADRSVLATGRVVTTEQKITYPDGTSTWLSTLKAPVCDQSGTIAGVITLDRDITDRKQLEIEMAETQNRLAEALAHMADGLVVFDAEDRLVYCNEQYRSMFPLTADVRVPGVRLGDILALSVERGEQEPDAGETAAEWIERLGVGLRAASEREIHLTDGRWIHARVTPSSGGASMVVLSEITRLKEAELAMARMNAQLRQLASTDSLTELDNRRAFDQRLEVEFARSARNGLQLSLLLVDIDRFKIFNDTYGHQAGDKCLQLISKCLKDTLKRPADTAARYGGEEFAVILPDTNEEGAYHMANALRLAVRALQLRHEGSEKGYVTVSVGVATFEPGGQIQRATELVGRADEGLYGAKIAGRDRVYGWSPRQVAGIGGRRAQLQ